MNKSVSIVLLALAAFATGCGGLASDYCDEVCNNCEDCSDKEYDQCEINAQEEVDVAGDYGCDSEISDLVDCFIRKYRCKDNHAVLEGDDCQSEASDLSKCEKDGSSLDN